MKIKALLKISLFLLLSSQAQATVWDDRNQWSEDFENAYAKWVQTAITPKMFTSPDSPYYGLPTDCADFVYMTRAIFAMENSLPFVLNTQWGKESKEKISNRTRRFDEVPDLVKNIQMRDEKGQLRTIELKKPLQNGKFRAFLLALGNQVGTWSLPYDTYPIKIDRKNLRPGTIYLRQGFNRMNALQALQTFITGTPPNPNGPPGHVLLVQDVRKTGSIDFIQSTLPKKVRELSTIHEIELLPTNANLGFRRFIQPQDIGKNDFSKFTGYSSEQFSELGRLPATPPNCNGEASGPECWNQTSNQKSNRRNITEFRKDVMKRLATQAESAQERDERLVKTLCGFIKQRADVILTAEITRTKYNGRCLDAGSYDELSTPSRDEQIRQLIKTMDLSDSRIRESIKNCESLKIDSSERTYSTASLIAQFAQGKYSSNPNDPIAARWGFTASTTKCRAP